MLFIMRVRIFSHVKIFYTVFIGDPLVHNGKNYKQAYHKTCSAVKYEQRVKVTEVKRFPH